MDPATARLLDRAAHVITDSERLIRETEHLQAVLAASRALLAASRDEPFPAGTGAADAFREVRRP
jgi:hypothetical protein